MKIKKEQLKKLAEFIGHQHPIYTLEAAPEPGRFFSAGGDKTVVEWNVKNPSLGIPVAQFNFTIYALCCLANKNILLAGTSEGGIHIIDLVSKKELKYILLPGEGVFDIRYSAQHHLIVASTAKGKLLFISPDDFSILETLLLSTEKIRNIAFNSSRPYLYAACSDTKVYVIDLVTRKSMYEFVGHNWATNALYYCDDKDELITCSKDAHIRIWDIKKQFELIKTVPAHNYAIYQIVYNPKLKIFATASRDKTIKLWNEELDILVRINKEDFDGHSNSVNSVLWLNGHQLVSSGDDRRIILWSIDG
jgi:WD repeat-containing protein 61